MAVLISLSSTKLIVSLQSFWTTIETWFWKLNDGQLITISIVSLITISLYLRISPFFSVYYLAFFKFSQTFFCLQILTSANCCSAKALECSWHFDIPPEHSFLCILLRIQQNMPKSCPGLDISCKLFRMSSLCDPEAFTEADPALSLPFVQFS